MAKPVAAYSLPNDSVEGFNPVDFSLRFVRAMRQRAGLHHVPSLRTSLAIPQFLAARWFRLQRLDADDYIAAAVLNTPYEDQATAEQVARTILFPPKVAAKPKSESEAKADAKSKPDETAGIDDMLADLAALNIDLDALDQLDDLFDQESEATLGAYALFEQWLSSDRGDHKALAELMALFGGAGTLELHGGQDEASIRRLLQEMLQGSAGDWTPAHVEHGCHAGFGPAMAQSAHLPWELGGVLAGTGDQRRLVDHLDELAANASPDVLGRTLRFVRPFAADVDAGALQRMRAAAIARARDLTDWAALVDGTGEWLAPTPELVATSARQDVQRALAAAEQMANQFGEDLRCAVFDAWADTRVDDPPRLIELVQTAVPCPRWEQLLDTAHEALVGAIAAALASGDAETLLSEAVHSAKVMRVRGTPLVSQGAALLATDVLCLFTDPDAFLDTLDRFLAVRVVPGEQDRLIRHGVAIGVPEDEIYRRLGDALEQLTRMVEANVRDPAAYGRLLLRLTAIPPDHTRSLATRATADGNREAMAVLLAIDLANAAAACNDEELVLECIGFKGIGGGDNLLKQWYSGGQDLGGRLRSRIKAIAKAALLELGLSWASRAGGSLDEGLIPQNETRPLRASDDLDLLDIEGTVENLIGEGRTPDSLGEEDLFVHASARGRASFGVLIDISGSMAGEELALCCIAVVMLLARLQSEEIAIALFESDTHVVKTFDEHKDLDRVADDLLDLQARGGTRVEAALHWIREQFAARQDSRVQLLFLLSDFCFFETADELARHAEGLAELDIHLLAASHGMTDTRTRDGILEKMAGDLVLLKTMSELPAALNDAIAQVADLGG